MMCSRPPRPPLDGVVALLWHVRRESPPPLEWVLPSGQPQLLVQLTRGAMEWTDAAGRPHPTAEGAVGGPFVAPVGVRGRDQQAVAGVLFHPGGLAALVDPVPVSALAGTYADLGDVLGEGAAAWIAAIRAAPTPAGVLAALERGLLGLVRRRSRRAPLERACAQLAAGARVRDVADALGASQRRFSATFRAEVGLAPKAYARVRRFQRALQGLRTLGAGDLAGLALRSGYYDQAHLNHEFRALAGLACGTVACAIRSATSGWSARRSSRSRRRS